MLQLAKNPPIVTPDTGDFASYTGDWMVAHTKARQEKSLAVDLLNNDVKYFLPMVKRETFSGGRKRQNLYPLFTGYVFFCGTREDRYNALKTNRLCQVIPVDDPEQLITELTALRTALEVDEPLDLYPFAKNGQRCRVTKGPMAGVEGTIIDDNKVHRLILQISMLGVGAALQINADFLEPID